MSISSSLINALSGLTATSRLADIVASNTANAMTEGYARREVQLASRALSGEGAGVRVVGVTRDVNEIVQRDLRLANSATAGADLRTDFYTRIETALGLPTDDYSLSAKLAQFEGALIEAASRPDSETRLNAVLSSARAISEHLNAASKTFEVIRNEADQKIAAQVSTLNSSLIQIDELNAQILAHEAAGRDPTALMDQRDLLIDSVSEIVPVRTVMRENNQVALYTSGGAILLEGTPAEIGFDSTGFISADMSLASGILSGLTLNGRPISASDTGILGGGSLGALFDIRDTLAPQAQTQLDAFARDLIERFSDPTLDPTLAPGAAGLFTDNGLALNPANELGLAQRIAISAAADPAQGGALWRLRDGLGATSPGDPGDATLLHSLVSTLNTSRTPASGTFSDGPNSSSDLLADLLSQVSGNRISAEDQQTYRGSQQIALKELSLADRVDTDQEMQMLLQIEQAYAANARVIQTLDVLINQILEL